MTQKNKETFESQLAELENIVHTLEGGELPLEESMKLYERGVKLTTQCAARLREAKLRVEELQPKKDLEKEKGGDADGNQ